ncbi:Cas1p-domain-containing protein [Zopfia rhizophila CBS 207.26]|uniref:Cas1p-domain-containing protein n=1 Tax=Zopfia rhizophila CBS 207.26 TaxID=1314779 RepID=A0A6A6ETG8_9PEZI|nr:Cas1p-domain-containing protein [Zopfia rhizophila CBS 207.26]
MPRLGLPRPASLADAFNKASFVQILVVVVTTFYRQHVYDAIDPYKCEALLNHGQWLDSPDLQPEHKPFLTWQPPGCMLHEYRAPEMARCNGGGKILFVGDTGTRQVFWAAARKLDTDRVWKERNKLDTHEDIAFSKDGANLKFLWDPWLNSSALYEELNEYRKRRDPDSEEKEVSLAKSGSGLQSVQRSVVILIGGGLWHARHIRANSFKHFKDTIDNITASAYSRGSMASLRTLPLSGSDGVQDQIFFAPVIEPQYERLSPSRVATIVPEKINGMNGYLEQLSLHQGLKVLWSYANMTQGRPETYGESGIHVIENVAGRMADVLLNLRCNAKAAHQDGYPFDRTCCNGYRPTNWVQITGIFSALVILPAVAFKAARGTPTSPVRVLFSKSIARQRSNSVSANSTASVPLALLTLLLCVCYCFLADRTQVFNKVRKLYTVLDFRVLIAVIVVGCLLTIRGPPSSPGRRRSDSFPGSLIRQTFLPRSQSEEFKGWMQIYVLIYCYTGASGELDFYEVLRIFLALYLFLSGYGHTMYFLQKKDYSLQRVAAVLIRLNLLAVLLSFMMARPYTSYYFAPLVSFWFLIVYFTLKPGNRRNDSISFVVGKMICSGLFVTGFIHLRGILEFIFFILRFTCRANLSVDEWRFHLGLDKYIVYVGMLVAIVYRRVSTILNIPQLRPNVFVEMLTDYFNAFQAFFVFAALVTVTVFWIVTRCSPNKADYNRWMPYISWLPVVSFVILRNATRFLRNYHCAAFAWLGRISLETYLLSHHIWLAGDGRGLLRTGLFKGDDTIQNDRWRDLALLTPIFIWLAWRASTATATVTSWIMKTGDDEAKREEAAKSAHSRAGSELAFPNYDDALPSMSTQGDMKSEMEKKRKRFGTPSDLRRLVVIGVVVWVANLVSQAPLRAEDVDISLTVKQLYT